LKKFKRDFTDTNKLLTKPRIDGVAGPERERSSHGGSSSGKEKGKGKEKESLEIKPKIEDEGVSASHLKSVEAKCTP